MQEIWSHVSASQQVGVQNRRHIKFWSPDKVSSQEFLSSVKSGATRNYDRQLFFNEQREQSKVKATLVQKYFWAWAKVILGAQEKNQRANKKIVYIDLFSGPGRYKDGAMSTPLLILEEAIKDTSISPYLVTIFNDKDANNSNTLKNEIQKLPGIQQLAYYPEIYCSEVVSEDIVKWFNEIKLAPTLFFVDPWGYKGLSLRLINSVLKNWGCDCIFFFNYNRISMGIRNPLVRPHMEALFESRYEQVAQKIENTTPAEREALIIEELCEALNEMGRRKHFILPFRFRNEKGTRTSHHLIFVSKDFKGYEIMKEIMAKESSSENEGVASFEYNLADERCPFLFQYTRPLESLRDDLLTHFAGQTLTTWEIYRKHCVGTPFILKNYKEVLKVLDEAGIITIRTANGKKRRKGTFSESISVTFPRR